LIHRPTPNWSKLIGEILASNADPRWTVRSLAAACQADPATICRLHTGEQKKAEYSVGWCITLIYSRDVAQTKQETR
jgi:hypothetical protein